MKPVEAADPDLDVARRVLRLESDALSVLADSLDGQFVAALDLLEAVDERGRVIVTGMGKSGHVARKLAATLASTGTPAHYVHPGEASHGDLGMVTRVDLLLALSNSGDTVELADILAHAARLAVPIIAITGKGSSSLGDAATLTLVLPSAVEACPMGLAPTTSTTMAMALGDALAVALLQRRQFSAADFKRLHPGGVLGRRLLWVRDIMRTGEAMPLVGLATPMSEVLLVMTQRSLGCAGVLDGSDRLAGIITDGDLRRHMSARLVGETAGRVMTRNPRTIRPQALAAEAIATMNDGKITNLFVVDEERLVGIVHLHDCLRAGLT